MKISENIKIISTFDSLYYRAKSVGSAVCKRVYVTYVKIMVFLNLIM